MAVSIESKVLTDNPLLDEIIYNCRQLCAETVLKDQDEADKYETLESIQNGDILIDIAQGHINFGRFYYSKELLMKIPSVSEANAELWSIDNSLIPQDLRPECIRIAQEEFIKNYIEYNDYYRCLHGEPNYDATGQWEGLWIDTTTIVPGVKKVPSISDHQVDENYQLIHLLDISYIETMYDDGIFELIYNDEDLLASFGLKKSDVRYLFHMGTRSISYYDARRADKFELLYCTDGDSAEVTRRYKELLDANRLMTLYTTYSEAYKFQSPYYDKFIMIFIIIQTIIDMIVELPEYIIRRDVFDARTCAYIFESAGVDYFSEIPLRYQVALVKNLNKLIKFKSTDKCIVDICSIFGCKDIRVFKYYILRDRNVTNPVDQEYLNETKLEYINEDEIRESPDNDKNYDLKFLKVPIGESYDNYIRDESNYVTYDSMTEGDPYWTGDKTYDEVKNAIKDTDFTLLRSKYYSTEAVIDIAKRSFTVVYFINILLYNKIDKSQLLVSLPNINNKKKFELVDVIITLYALGYTYWGVEDSIMDSQSKVLSILGFNFEADLEKIQEYLAEKYPYGTVNWDELGINGFKFPTDGKILTYKQLMEIYTTNKEIYDHVTYEISHPQNRDLYYAYRYIYDSLFVMKCHMDYYAIDDTNKELYSTYTEFLRYKSPELYSYIMDIKNITQVEKRQEACVNAIQSITTYLKDYVDQDLVRIDELFSGLPSISLDFIVDYINEVINFFKSFKIFTQGTTIQYLFTDKFNNSVIIVDWMLLHYIFEKSDTVYINDIIGNITTNMTMKEKANWIIDKVWLDVNTWVKKNFTDYYENEKYKEFCTAIKDAKEHFSHFDVFDQYEDQIGDKIVDLLISLTLKDDIEIRDQIYDIIFVLSKEEHINEQISDLIQSILIHLLMREKYFLKDDILRFTRLYGNTFSGSSKFDMIGKFIVSKTLQDKSYRPLDDYYLIITNS